MVNLEDAGEHETRLLLAIKILFKKHPKLLLFLFETNELRLRESSETLISEAAAFSSGEYILVRVALDLWSGSGDARVWEVYEILDETNFENVLLSLQFLQSKYQRGDPICGRQLNISDLKF